MPIHITSIFVLISIALTSCLPNSSSNNSSNNPIYSYNKENEYRRLEQNRYIWSRHKLHHYRFKLSIQCMCSIDTTRSVSVLGITNGNTFKDLRWITVEILNGKIASITDENGGPFPEYLKRLNWDKYPVPDLIVHGFFMIQRGIEEGADTLKVEYDKQYGFPSKIIKDSSINRIDDEIEFKIDKFEVLK